MPPDAVLDLEILREMGVVSGVQAGGEIEGIINLFLREERPRLAQLSRLLEERNGAEFSRAAHNLAGSCAILGARQAHRLAIGLELAANQGAWSEMDAGLASLREAWVRLEAALADFRAGGHV